MLTICSITQITLLLMLFKSDEFELMIEDFICKAKFNCIKSNIPPKSRYAFNSNVKLTNKFFGWIINCVKKICYALENIFYDTLEGSKFLKINQPHYIRTLIQGMIAERFLLKFPKVPLSLTSIMLSGYHYFPQITAFSSSMKKHFVGVLCKNKIVGNYLLNFMNNNLFFSHFFGSNDPTRLNYIQNIELLTHEIKFRNGPDPNFFLKHTTFTNKLDYFLDRHLQINITLES